MPFSGFEPVLRALVSVAVAGASTSAPPRVVVPAQLARRSPAQRDR
jgi:hypothetical protein